MKGQVGQKMQLKGMYSLSGIGRNFVRGVFLKKKVMLPTTNLLLGRPGRGLGAVAPSHRRLMGSGAEPQQGSRGQSPRWGVRGRSPRAIFRYYEEDFAVKQIKP